MNAPLAQNRADTLSIGNKLIAVGSSGFVQRKDLRESDRKLAASGRIRILDGRTAGEAQVQVLR